MFRLTEIEKKCEICGHSLQEHSIYYICKCGAYPYDIIYENGSGVSRSFSLSSEQNKLFLLLKTLEDVNSPKEQIIAANVLPYEDRIVTLVTGSEDDIFNALIRNTINKTGHDFIYPNTILGTFITGFWLKKELNYKYIKIHKGGLLFSYTLRENVLFDDYIFVFQNPERALSIISEIYRKTNTYPPVVADPKLNVLDSLEWLPKRKIIVITKTQNIPEDHPIAQINPYVIYEKSVIQTQSAEYRLRAYSELSRRLFKRRATLIGISNRSSIIVKNREWVFARTKLDALNVDIVIRRCIRIGRLLVYLGYVKYDQQQYRFMICGKTDFYNKLSEFCERINIPLYCAPSIKRHLADLAIKRSKIQYLSELKIGLHRHTNPREEDRLRLPNLIITPTRIRNLYNKENELSDIPAGILWKPADITVNKDTTIDELAQLAFIYGIDSLLITNLVKKKPRLNLLVLKTENEIPYDTQRILDVLKIYKNTQKIMPFWPTVVDKFNSDTQHSILFVNPIEMSVYSCCTDSIIYIPRKHLGKLLSEEKIVASVILWLQKCIEIVKNDNINKIPKRLDDLIFNTFKDLYKLDDAQMNVIRKYARRSRKKLQINVFRLVGTLYNLGYIPESMLVLKNRRFHIPVAKINKILRMLNFPSILPETTTDKIISIPKKYVTKARGTYLLGFE